MAEHTEAPSGDSSPMSSVPRTVLVADDKLYLKLESDPRSVHLLEDRDAMVVPYRHEPTVNAREVLAVRELLLTSGQLTRDALLVKNPYEAASFELAEFAPEAFASAKYHAIAVVAGMLGATEMRIVEASVDRTTVRWDADLTAKLPVFGGGAKASRDATKRLEKKVEARMEYEGSAPDRDAALAYLRRRNLWSDPELQALIDLRSIQNRAKKYTLTFSGTRESATNLRSALELAGSVSTKKAKVGATFTRNFESVTTIDITTEITF
jgi:hypothetical protein